MNIGFLNGYIVYMDFGQQIDLGYFRTLIDGQLNTIINDVHIKFYMSMKYKSYQHCRITTIEHYQFPFILENHYRDFVNIRNNYLYDILRSISANAFVYNTHLLEYMK